MNLLYLNQFKTTTLSVPGGIDASQTDSIVAQSVAGIDTTKPGIACVSYTDPINVDNAEWFEYQSINSTTKEFQGVVRGAEGFSAKSHDNGAVIAFPVSESHINRLADALSIESDPTNGVTGVIDDDTMATASAITLATSESIKAYINNGAWFNGWIPVSETWTRTGNHTFTVSGDLTAKYRKGTKVRYKDGGAYDYGTVISSSYSSPDTTVTLATNTDYAMAEATITDTYISYIENPEGFPQWFAWTPIFSGAISSIGNAAIVAAFQITGNIVHCRIKTTFGNTTSFTNGNLQFTTPTTIFNAVGHFCGTVYFEDAATAGYTGFIQTASTTIVGISAIATAGTYGGNSLVTNLVPFTWTTNDYFNGSFFYQMA